MFIHKNPIVFVQETYNQISILMIFKENAQYKGLDIWECYTFDSFGSELGRHGSPRAHTEGQRSHGLQEGFWMPPRPLEHHIISINDV